MKWILFYSFLLIAGLIGSQQLPREWEYPVMLLTLWTFSFIMIHSGYELGIDKRKPREYINDFFIACTTATIPWMLCSSYFYYFVGMASWEDALIFGRFASPTSTGVLLSLLSAAGISATWVFRKAKLLAVFDDIYAILLMVPFKFLMVGFKWEIFWVCAEILLFMSIAWMYYAQIKFAATWAWVLIYSLAITLVALFIHGQNPLFDEVAPIYLEVMLPSFCLGCILKRVPRSEPEGANGLEGHLEGPGGKREQKISKIITALFMLCVGLSMPAIPFQASYLGTLIVHVSALTILMNIGKMFPLFCYKNQASFRERLALCLSLFVRGEAGVRKLLISVDYGISNLAGTIATWTMTVNFLLIGLCAEGVLKLIKPKERK